MEIKSVSKFDLTSNQCWNSIVNHDSTETHWQIKSLSKLNLKSNHVENRMNIKAVLKIDWKKSQHRNLIENKISVEIQLKIKYVSKYDSRRIQLQKKYCVYFVDLGKIGSLHAIAIIVFFLLLIHKKLYWYVKHNCNVTAVLNLWFWDSDK